MTELTRQAWLAGTMKHTMTVRRWTFFLLVGLTMIGLVALLVASLHFDGFGGPDFLMTLLFVLFLPWSVIGFWNAAIGFVIMRFSRDPLAAVMPVSPPTNEPISSSTAIVMCIRNEDVALVFRTIELMIEALAALPDPSRFHLYILSDTTDPVIAASEKQAADQLSKRHPRLSTYRRRDANTGFKAGNIRDFCDTWGASHDFMITLDADSVMSVTAIERLVRIMEANPRLGIVQSLAVGLPSTSAFTRLFQFGMRLGMRSYTLGSAWWQGDCGPYWGHNAIIRIAPFAEHCHLPRLLGSGPLSGDILSHDQVEAVLMRRAGYECRVLPIEDGSYEMNPPALIEFIRRDLRWCQGNMQYVKLLGLKDVSLISQYQLCFAILMFAGSPASVLFMLIAALRSRTAAEPAALFEPGAAQLIVLAFIVMGFAPKLATLVDVLLRGDLRRSYGGGVRVSVSALLEAGFMVLVLPIMTISQTMFLTGLAFGKAMGWSTQQRGDHALSLADAARRLWPHTLAGFAGALWFSAISPAAFWWTLPLTLGPMLAIPIAVATSHPSLGRWMARQRLCPSPEETDTPPILHALKLPALLVSAPAR
ncbi:MAG: glucans biosynthesis glucosyltransferase MdoH [Beijerinckiaceae bacterium]|nr:glucans biosynthesis glucosyltransferase MdoH [Beijerinckiaceae bacterium]